MIGERLERFIGIHDYETVPDAKSIWLWREQLIQRKVFDTLFTRFWELLKEHNIETTSGVIVDATFVEKPQQRNTKEEHETIKKGDIPESWEKPEHKNKLRQKDTDATWTKKHGKTYYARVEHVFAYMERSMGRLVIRCVGIIRAHARIVCKALLYNMIRYCFLTRVANA